MSEKTVESAYINDSRRVGTLTNEAVHDTVVYIEKREDEYRLIHKNHPPSICTGDVKLTFEPFIISETILPDAARDERIDGLIATNDDLLKRVNAAHAEIEALMRKRQASLETLARREQYMRHAASLLKDAVNLDMQAHECGGVMLLIADYLRNNSRSVNHYDAPPPENYDIPF